MVRAPCCSKVGLMRGPWSAKEDALLTNYIQKHGEGQWRSLPKKAGLLRCGKSCRLRWMNYLRPGIKRGNISEDEEDLIVRLHGLLGNRWSLIAGRLPGRTDNEIKNYWNTYLLKKLQNAGINTNPHKNLPEPNKKSSKKDTTNYNKNSQDNDNPKKKKKVVNNKNKKSSMKEQGAVINNNAFQGKVNDDDEARVHDCAKVKVYLPKPIRVSSILPRTDSLDSLASVEVAPASSGSTAVVEAEMAWQQAVFEIENVGDYYYGGSNGNGADDQNDFLMPLLRSCGSSDDLDMLDMDHMVYDEYLQLL